MIVGVTKSMYYLHRFVLFLYVSRLQARSERIEDETRERMSFDRTIQPAGPTRFRDTMLETMDKRWCLRSGKNPMNLGLGDTVDQHSLDS